MPTQDAILGMMVKYPKIAKTFVAENCLFQPQEVHATLSHHLDDVQAMHKKLADCNSLGSSPKGPIFLVKAMYGSYEVNIKTT